MDTLVFNPTISSLAAALKLGRPSDRSAHNAVDRVLAQLFGGEIVYEFDGVELRVQSFSDKGDAPKIYVSDGESCTCPHQPRPGKETTCKHITLYALLLAELALTSPARLRAAFLAALERQPEPEDIYGTQADDDMDEALPTYATLDTCGYCDKRLLDHELRVGVCDPCASRWRPRPAAAVALPRRSQLVQVNAKAQEAADALIAA